MTNLVDSIACIHGMKEIPNTHQRGTNRIDFISISPKIFKYIYSCDITSFNKVAPSDHRCTFIDVDFISFLQNQFHNIIDLKSLLLQSNDIKLVSKYKKKHLQNFIKQKYVIERIDKIQNTRTYQNKETHHHRYDRNQ